jgi:glycosyltransferase involved in cell wall biosynthesis
MKIVFYPAPDGTNQYINLAALALTTAGHEVYWFSLKDLITGKYRHNIYFQLNWFETCVWLKSFLCRLVILWILWGGHKRIVFVMHNKQAHIERHGISRWYCVFLAYLLYKISYRIVIHSHDSLNYIRDRYHKKTVHIPHPSYVDAYGPIVRNGGPHAALRLLFFGQIRPYKNIELLIDCVSRFAPEEVFLTIAGAARSTRYVGKLRDKIKGRANIEARFQFFEDTAVPALLSQCDVLVFPYDLRSSLNSGAVLLAFSYQKTVIAAEIGTLKDMEAHYFLSYTYGNEKEHAAKLTETIGRAAALQKANPPVFAQWGEYMYREILKQNAPEKLEEGFKRLYAN